MRLKNVKGANEIIINGKYYVDNPYQYKGIWRGLFDNNNPIYIEIGMGKGNFIIENAKRYPDINFIGIEKYDSVIVRAIQKSNELELNNLKIVRMDAKKMEEVFDKEIDTIYLNFSDPWPKVRHHNRRLTSEIFLNKYDKIFKGKKEIYLRTDNPDLYTYSIETLSKHKYELFDVTFDLHKKEENLITTEYEDKFVSKNMPIYSLKAIKEDV